MVVLPATHLNSDSFVPQKFVHFYPMINANRVSGQICFNREIKIKAPKVYVA